MGALRTGYLVLYNLASTAAWSFLLFELVKFQSSGAPQTEIYKTLNVPLKIAQSTAVLEVLHAVFKIVRSNPLNTFLQVLSRVTVLYCLLDMFEEVCLDALAYIGLPNNFSGSCPHYDWRVCRTPCVFDAICLVLRRDSQIFVSGRELYRNSSLHSHVYKVFWLPYLVSSWCIWRIVRLLSGYRGN